MGYLIEEDDRKAALQELGLREKEDSLCLQEEEGDKRRDGDGDGDGDHVTNISELAMSACVCVCVCVLKNYSFSHTQSTTFSDLVYCHLTRGMQPS